MLQLRVAAILFSSFAVLATAAAAQTPADPEASLAERVSGEWRLVGGRAAAQREIDRAIDVTTSGMLPLVSGMAARELRARNPVRERLTIDASSQQIRVVHGEVRFETVPGHPARMQVPGDDDTTMEVVQLFRDGRFEQIFTTSRGRRWNSYTPSSDGSTLTMEAVVSSDQLPRDLRYTLRYRRAR